MNLREPTADTAVQTEASGTQLRITIETLPTELTYDREGRQQWLARWDDATITYHDHLNELPAGVRAAAPHCLRQPGEWIRTK